jgi:acyl transferase domain-containing protein
VWDDEPRVALLFPGQGAQHVRMAAGLYRREAVFTAAVDQILDGMSNGDELRDDWLAERPRVSIDHVTRSTPLLFAIDYALGRLVMSWAIRPCAMLGHSIGEMAAAALTGTFHPVVAARLVDERVKVLASAPTGGMLAVAASPAELRDYLGGDLAIGAVNAPRQTVLSGLTDSIEAVTKRLRADGFICRRVPAHSPFHSPAMAPLAAIEAPAFANARINAPQLPLYSAYTGGRLSAAVAMSPDYWTRHPSMPVLFWPALEALLATGDYLLVEAGPSDGLASIARRHPAVAAGRSEVMAMLPTRSLSPDDDLAAVRAVAARLRDRRPAGRTRPTRTDQPTNPRPFATVGAARSAAH